jgi:hypothetical protein
MGDDKKTEGAAGANITGGALPRKSMLGEYVKEYGKTEKDIVLTGQLLPQYLGKQLLEKRCDEVGKRKISELTDEEIAAITPLVGLFHMVEVLPVQERKGEEKDFSPFSLIIREIRKPVVGFRGKDEKRVEVPVPVGGEILFAITGQKSVDKQIADMIRDPENIYLFAARPIGAEKVNDQPSAMTKYDTEVVKLDVKRADKGASWALPPWYMAVLSSGDLTGSIRNKEHIGLLELHSTEGFDITPVGNVINRKTGEIIGRFENGRVLPPKPEVVSSAAS